MFKITETKQKTSEILAEMKSKFDVWCWYDDAQLDKDFPPPTEIRTRYFKKTVEADPEMANKSASDLEKEGVKGITLRERLLMEIQYFDETGGHLDIDNWTLCIDSRYSGGGVPDVDWYSDYRGVGVSWARVDSQDSSLRTRVAVLEPSEPLVDLGLENATQVVKDAGYEVIKRM